MRFFLTASLHSFQVSFLGWRSHTCGKLPWPSSFVTRPFRGEPSTLGLSTFETSASNGNLTGALESLKDDQTLRIHMHPHPHGYRIYPFTWEELQEIVQRDLSLLCRSVEQQYTYEMYKVYLKRNWHSVYDHILCSKFQLPHVEEDGKRRAIPLVDYLASSETKSLRSLLPNEFPYHVQSPCQHWVLWVLGRPCEPGDIEWAKEELNAKLGPMEDFIHWINPPHLKSIPDIDHVHILCLPTV